MNPFFEQARKESSEERVCALDLQSVNEVAMAIIPDVEREDDVVVVDEAVVCCRHGETLA